MEAEKMRLEATLKALEGELAASKARLRTATAEQKALSEGCQRCEQGYQTREVTRMAQALDRDHAAPQRTYRGRAR